MSQYLVAIVDTNKTYDASERGEFSSVRSHLSSKLGQTQIIMLLASGKDFDPYILKRANNEGCFDGYFAKDQAGKHTLQTFPGTPYSLDEIKTAIPQSPLLIIDDEPEQGPMGKLKILQEAVGLSKLQYVQCLENIATGNGQTVATYERGLSPVETAQRALKAIEVSLAQA